MVQLTKFHNIIDDLIVEIRGQKVMVDLHLAELYGVTLKRLREQIRRNRSRFPQDFMFELNIKETSELAANCGEFSNIKHSRSQPYAFTEHGALMLASVLNSQAAIETSIQVIRVFVRTRKLLARDQELNERINQLEKSSTVHDQRIREILVVIKKLILYDENQTKTKVGFQL